MSPPGVEKSEPEKRYHQDRTEDVKQDQGAVIVPVTQFLVIVDRSVYYHEPRYQSQKQKNLPQPSQLQELPALMAQPEPHFSEKALYPSYFTQETSSCNQQDGDEEHLDQSRLPSRLNPPYNGRQIYGCPHPRRCYPEYGQLQMPTLRPAVRNEIRYPLEVKACRMNSVVSQKPAEICLDEK